MARSFVPVFSLTNNSANTGFQADINVVQEDSGYIWIENRLKSGDVLTEIRVLPVLDERGEEYPALAPDGSKDSPESTLGAPFALVELASIFDGKSHVFLSSIQGEDREGNPVPAAQSPTMSFMRRLGYKVYEQGIVRSAGLDTDIPETWFTWREERILSNPQQVYLIRAVAMTINGVAQGSNCLGVFAIPKSAEEQFIQNLCTKIDISEPLSLTNNELGDICSCEGGRTLRLKRYDSKAANGEDRGKTTYAILLGKHLPLSPENVQHVIKPWEEILTIPTVEDSIERLLGMYGNVAVDFAFRKTNAFYKYVPEDIKGCSSHIAEPRKIDDVRKLKATGPTATIDNKDSLAAAALAKNNVPGTQAAAPSDLDPVSTEQGDAFKRALRERLRKSVEGANN